MFSSDQNGEKVFQISTTTYQHHTVPQDLILPDALMDDSILNNDKGKGRQQKSLATLDSCEITHEDNDRKVMHRDMERNRRKEMNKLHGSLRSLLPLEYIKVNKLCTLSFPSSACSFLVLCYYLCGFRVIGFRK